MQSRLFLFNSLGFLLLIGIHFWKMPYQLKIVPSRFLNVKETPCSQVKFTIILMQKYVLCCQWNFFLCQHFTLIQIKVLSVFPYCSSQTSSWYILQADFLKTLLNKFTVQQCCTILIVGIKLVNILLGAHLFI